MSKHTSIMLSDEAIEIVTKYAQEHNCTRNRAINDLIIGRGNEQGLQDILKYVKAIYKNIKQ